LIREARPNASRARNIGACAATGDILVFLDDDILIQPDFLQVYADAFSSPNVQGVAGQILEGKAEVVTDLSERQRHRQIDWLYFPKNYAKRCTTGWIASGNFAVRRDRFFEVGGMDCNYRRGAFREESDFAMRFRENGGDFLFEPKASIYHLGMDGAPQGGSRNWIQNKRIAGWHHCVGDWYFTVKFINIRNWRDVFVASLRHFIFNRYNLTHPWLLPWLVVRWLIALPAAVYLRWRGPRLLGAKSL
jgi:glycosyltransferase involved in cell wall biosynthesis